MSLEFSKIDHSQIYQVHVIKLQDTMFSNVTLDS